MLPQITDGHNEMSIILGYHDIKCYHSGYQLCYVVLTRVLDILDVVDQNGLIMSR